MYPRVMKRIFDLFTAIIALVLLCIPFIIVFILIKLDSRGPIFFKQKRMGKNSKPFEIYKFRTMYVDAPHNKATADLDNADDQITYIGKLLRKTSIDELPQFINVIKGEMSVIGPRPVILSETELIEMRKRNGADGVKPGLTGLAQVHGRDSISNFKKASYDGIYAASLGLQTDFKIVLRTIWYVILHVGIKEGR